MVAVMPEKFEMLTLHKLALFLHPQYTMLRRMSTEEKQAVYQLARQFISVLESRVNERMVRNSQRHTQNKFSNIVIMLYPVPAVQRW